mmetsp:Transcript_14552/g.48213  ORF Transcript_14552/g.48213 Transcript_14552/m.48213 type:complete len:347 (-) Transcript_14552:1953-2993(-)
MNAAHIAAAISGDGNTVFATEYASAHALFKAFASPVTSAFSIKSTAARSALCLPVCSRKLASNVPNGRVSPGRVLNAAPGRFAILRKSPSDCALCPQRSAFACTKSPRRTTFASFGATCNLCAILPVVPILRKSRVSCATMASSISPAVARRSSTPRLDFGDTRRDTHSPRCATAAPRAFAAPAGVDAAVSGISLRAAPIARRDNLRRAEPHTMPRIPPLATETSSSPVARRTNATTGWRLVFPKPPVFSAPNSRESTSTMTPTQTPGTTHASCACSLEASPAIRHESARSMGSANRTTELGTPSCNKLATNEPLRTSRDTFEDPTVASSSTPSASANKPGMSPYA